MPKYLNIKTDQDLYSQVVESAAEDDRKAVDQTRYLLKLGLRYRSELREREEAVGAGKTQINAEALRRS